MDTADFGLGQKGAEGSRVRDDGAQPATGCSALAGDARRGGVRQCRARGHVLEGFGAEGGGVHVGDGKRADLGDRIGSRWRVVSP